MIKNSNDKNLDKDNDDLELKYIDITNDKEENQLKEKILDEMNLHKYCCRRMMLSNVHIISLFILNIKL